MVPEMSVPEGGITIAIDRGGTFTDVLAMIPGKPDYYFKLLSVNPDSYRDATAEGIRRVLEHIRGHRIRSDQPLSTIGITAIRIGTTVATNALLERKGTRCALLITKGFGDLGVIGDQTRPKLFDLNVRKPGVIYAKAVEVDERVTQESYTEDPSERTFTERIDHGAVKAGVTGEVFRVLRPLDEEASTRQLESLYAEGFQSIAVCLVHGYNFQEHETILGQIASNVGFKNISLSHKLLPAIKLLHRAHSTTADAYLTPTTQNYISDFLRGLEAGSEDHTRIEFMQSDGGLTSFDKFSGLRAVLSGPAGGVVSYARTCYDKAHGNPVIGFDMGGTSTDVSRYDGAFEHISDSVTAGVHISCPQLDIVTVAAGGGSILTFRNGIFMVGPESAGANPGPACYLKGGPLTVTDANLILGRILPQTFPQVFGPDHNQPLGAEVTREQFTELTARINKDLVGRQPEMSVEEVALGFLQVANINMSKPIRALTENRGFDVATHDLVSFGGAGGQHACDIGKTLGVSRVVIHKYSSIMSAYGIALADIVEERQAPSFDTYNCGSESHIENRLKALVKDAKKSLQMQGITEDSIQIDKFLNMRYHGSDSQLMIPVSTIDANVLSTFTRTHLREFSFIDESRKVIVDDIRVRASGSRQSPKDRRWDNTALRVKPNFSQLELSSETTCVYFESGWLSTTVIALDSLQPGTKVKGPAILHDQTQTIIVTPYSEAICLAHHIIIELSPKIKTESILGEVDPVQLAIFGNRFMGIAEDMGRTLQKISISTNIRERLDFSCAIFDGQGYLTANAPHVPVHLGSMSRAVQNAARYWNGNLSPGDVIATNHPLAGGTHLPDITIISPVFESSSHRIEFFVAARAHHAEIGGIAPGSMPSDSVELYQEGAAFMQWKIVSQGKFDMDGLRHHFIDVPGSYPDCSPSRRLQDNYADLKAQIAANQKGINLIRGLYEEYGHDAVLFYMRAVRRTAECAVRDLLRTMAKRFQDEFPLIGIDYLDDGSPIQVSVSIDGEKGDAIFDFTGTGIECFNCFNAPIAITHSAILYVLRCLVGVDIPLNDGCLEPITVIVPEGTILNPSSNAAVCAGNTLTSQRITDVILKAFRACAASHGCMNILSFGIGGWNKETKEFVPGYGYGETIAGGCGAGPGWHGYSGSHVHMTNTKITDPEIMEKRYPVVLNRFCLRAGSGGNGQWKGGDGVIREITFTEPCHASILSQRRVLRPYGMAGGEDGARGVNRLGRKLEDGTIRWTNLGGCKEVDLNTGDRIMLCTPGGGGYGTKLETDCNKTSEMTSQGK